MYSIDSNYQKSECSDILKGLIDRRKEIQQKAAFYDLELKKIDAAYRILADNSIRRIKWSNEAINCFNTENKHLKTVEILDWIFRNQSDELRVPLRRRIYITGLSVALNNLIKKGVIRKIEKPGQKGYSYGLSTWFEIGNNDIKKN